MTNYVTGYHVTSPEAAESILKEGFAPGWGDAGFGVYFFDNVGDAVGYGEEGGWDQSLQKYVILKAKVPASAMSAVRVDPSWPNTEDYETVFWVPCDQDDDMGYDSIHLDDDWVIFDPRRIQVVRAEKVQP